MSILKNKIMKRILILTFVLLPLAVFAFSSSEIPEGHSPSKADDLAQEVMDNLNFKAWQETKIVKWTSPGAHRYVWYKKQDSVVISWGKYKAHVSLSQQTGKVFEKGKRVQEDERKLIEKAIAYFNNDSFWLSAPFKMLDVGSSRELVDLKNGQVGLKVFYKSGGSTPGDTYLWILEEGKPVAYKMWVSAIPFGGVKAKWKDWTTTATGAEIALSHKILFFNIKIKDLVLE